MTQANPPLTDLTRWNRTGLSRFDYVDGDAAVWLEELRIAMLGLYLKGAPDAQRMPEFWRDLYLRPVEDWPDVTEAAEQVAWKRLAPATPPQRETRGRRNERLLSQYAARTDDHAWEINRAFARAAHVLLGTLNAYANEGYLRTATQWDSLRRLAAMVNYQPTPPASATTTVGLLLMDDTGAVEIAAGLAMKHTPLEGGAPLIFETLQPVNAHPAFNAARAEGWNQNGTNIVLNGVSGHQWLADDKTPLATGDVAVLMDGAHSEVVILSKAKIDPDTGIATLAFVDPVNSNYRHYSTRLWVGPSDVRLGLKQSRDRQVVVEAPSDLGAVVAGDLVEVVLGKSSYAVEIVSALGGELVLNMDLPDGAEVQLRTMQSFALDSGNQVEVIGTPTKKLFVSRFGTITGQTGAAVTGEQLLDVPGLYRFDFNGIGNERAFAFDATAAAKTVTIIRKTPTVLPARDPKGKIQNDGFKRPVPAVVSFVGKPPKGLADGDWFVARDMVTEELTALQVRGIRVASGEYHVEFHRPLTGASDRTEFHGPLTVPLRAVGYDINPNPAFTGNKITLEQIPAAAAALIKPGRKVLIRHLTDTTDTTIAARVEDALALSGDRLQLGLVEYEGAQGWPRGHVSFALNTVQISHGESKGSKLLGSGDGERSAQEFPFAVKPVSHIPSTAAEAGVAPDMDIAVDGERWEYRDYIDPTAEGTRAWSTTLKDDGTLRIHFRRRLVTGQNNVVVTRYRVGAGVAGTGIAPLSFAKPMKKNRYVEGVFQPFATSGGADREPVSKLRQSTPQRLSANGRAVSLADMEHLAMRHSAVLRARAEMIPSAGALKLVRLTVALAGGASVAGLVGDLGPSISARTLPGVGLSFQDYQHLPLHVGVKVRSDLSVNNATDIKAAAEARLFSVFSLENRGFGQSAYISEVLAALETVSGIETVLATRFDLGLKPVGTPDPWPPKAAVNDGKIAALYAAANQIIHIAPGSATAVAVEVEDIR